MLGENIPSSDLDEVDCKLWCLTFYPFINLIGREQSKYTYLFKKIDPSQANLLGNKRLYC